MESPKKVVGYMSCNVCNKNTDIERISDGYICTECLEKLPNCVKANKKMLPVDTAKRLITNAVYNVPFSVFKNKCGELGFGQDIVYLAGYCVPISNILDIHSFYYPIDKLAANDYCSRVAITLTLKDPQIEITEEIGRFFTEKKGGKLQRAKEVSFMVDLIWNRTKTATSQSNHSNTYGNYKEQNSYSSQQKAASFDKNKELALATFMLEEPFTEKELKLQRNRLLKVFHPDEASGMSSEYATKINNAYDILKKYCTN